MSEPHDSSHESQAHEPEKNSPILPEEAGSRALSEALRSSFVIVRVLMGILIILFFASGFFTVDSQHKAIILRLGKPLGEGDKALLGPGFHWAFPKPIDEVVQIPISQIQIARSTVGWYATTPEMEAAKAEPPPGPTLNPATDSYALTSDANIIHVRATLRYRVTDPLRYVFEFSDAPAVVTNALNNALLFAAAHYTVDNALTRDVTGFRAKVRSRLNQLIDQQQLGITIEQSDVEAKAPRQLTTAFGAVLEASINRDKAITQAGSYTNEILSKARGDAAARINAAETDKSRQIKFVSAEAQKFQGLLLQYKTNSAALFTRWQIETLQRVLTNAQEKIFVPTRADGKPRELRLQLGREPKKTVPEQP